MDTLLGCLVDHQLQYSLWVCAECGNATADFMQPQTPQDTQGSERHHQNKQYPHLLLTCMSPVVGGQLSFHSKTLITLVTSDIPAIVIIVSKFF